ncbi:MAG TPA: hypothetical protein VK625_19735, partial [Flavitalea sp.]|nr:hypothetical protein [Flavitalea sp.]
QAIAKGAGINKAELPTLLNKLQEEHLIDQSTSGGVVSIGVTTSSVLDHTSNIFNNSSPSQSQIAALSLAERISAAPIGEAFMKEFLSDSYKITSKVAAEVIQLSEDVGFIDVEIVDDKKLLFNGNLFKTESLQKATKILDTLTPQEVRALQDIDGEISKVGCIPFDKAVKSAGQTLLEKVQSIGMYEFNKVSNEKETKYFITKPDSFSKFGNPFAEDALDLAKAFVASLSYGMNYSTSMRGRIDYLQRLLQALIAGREVGPAPAIGQDYKFLELKRVVQIIPRGGNYFSMRLLKKEVGELALQVMQKGDAVESTLLVSSSNVVSYDGPEKTRRETRKKRQVKQSDTEVANLLRTLRSN